MPLRISSIRSFSGPLKFSKAQRRKGARQTRMMEWVMSLRVIIGPSLVASSSARDCAIAAACRMRPGMVMSKGQRLDTYVEMVDMSTY